MRALCSQGGFFIFFPKSKLGFWFWTFFLSIFEKCQHFLKNVVHPLFFITYKVVLHLLTFQTPIFNKPHPLRDLFLGFYYSSLYLTVKNVKSIVRSFTLRWSNLTQWNWWRTKWVAIMSHFVWLWVSRNTAKQSWKDWK